jgi:hypothetical protein
MKSMKTSKGYIIPSILVVLLLILSGIFLFVQKPVESPIVDTAPTPVRPATTTQDVIDQTEDVEESQATSTDSTNTIDQETEIGITSTTTGETLLE